MPKKLLTLVTKATICNCMYIHYLYFSSAHAFGSVYIATYGYIFKCNLILAGRVCLPLLTRMQHAHYALVNSDSHNRFLVAA